MEYEAFDNSFRKLPKLWTNVQSSEKESELLKKININIQSEHYSKKINKVQLLSNYNLTFSNSQFEFILNNFPDWAVPMSRVIPIYYTEDGIDIDGTNPTLSFVWQFNYFFHRVAENSYILKIYVSGLFQDFSLNNYPLFLDLNLYLVNEYIYNTSQEGVS